MPHSRTIALALAMFCAGVAAHAADTQNPPPPSPPGPMHSRPDANGDGVVTREEAQGFPWLAQQFDAIDTNHDGNLDRAEMDAHRAAMHEQMREKARERWKAADTDGNGSLSRAEAEASMPHVAQNFDKLDANGDGQISPDEMHNFRRADDGGQARRGLQQKFAAADRDGDGALDHAEAQATMPKLAEHFADADANHDGKLSLAEIEAYRARR